ncbi:MAG: helix-turn-helix domain-containing protein [Candidatus Aminicenantes bacterium]|nr:MAG: helix-turn-helix domain-containing protein [Candidatus Aminicenantes bacterium]
MTNTVKNDLASREIRGGFPIKRILKFIILFGCLLLSLVLNSQTGKRGEEEQGNPFIRNYTYKEYNAHFQNWAAIQDKRGVMYFGNGHGVLEYDGSTWRLIKVTNNSVVRSLAIDSQGTIYVGAVGEFGCLTRNPSDPTGNLTYDSLTNRLNEKDKNFGDVWSINVTSHGIYFKTYFKIFRFYNGKINVIPVSSGPFSFTIKDKVFINNKGIYVLNGNTPLLLPGTQKLLRKSTGLLYILPYTHHRILIATENKGFFIYDLTMVLDKDTQAIIPDFSKVKSVSYLLKKFPTAIDEYILFNRLYSGVKINHNHYAFATLKGGIIIMDQEGKLVRVINKNRGLRKNMVSYLFADQHQNLWAALNNGISYIELQSPITQFNGRNGLEETVMSITRHRGKLFIGTLDGLFYSPGYRLRVSNDAYQFLPVKNINKSCWDFIPLNGTLFVASNLGVICIDDPPGRDHKYYVNKLVYCFGQSKKFPFHIFLGLRDGLAALEVKSNIKFIGKETFKQVKGNIRKIISDPHGNLWLTVQYGGIVYLRFTGDGVSPSKVYCFGTRQGLPRMDWNYVYSFNNQIIVGTGKGIYKVDIPANPNFDAASLRFVPENTFAKQVNDESLTVGQMFFDKQGKAWLETGKGLGILSKDQKGMYRWEENGLKKIGGQIQKIWVEERGIAWICTSDGLFRYDPAIKKNYKTGQQALIRKVTLHNGSVIFNGLKHPGEPVSVFEHKNNSLSFEYAVPFYENASDNRFKYILEGFDKEWSEWTADKKAVYTNLPEGDYCFKVKARTFLGHESQPAAYGFSISPPWHRTTLAYVGYGITLIIILILGYIAHRVHVKRVILREQRKYEKCHLDPKKGEEYIKKLFQVMETQKPYLNPGLNLSSLAKKVGIQRHYISQILNINLKQSFWDFINEYRINEAKKILSAPGRNDHRILQVAYEVGFNSNVSFNRAFKRHTGMTPSTYKKRSKFQARRPKPVQLINMQNPEQQSNIQVFGLS